MTSWEAEAKNLGYSSEAEMWKDLYPKNSLSQLATKFKKGINTIRTRVAYHGVDIQSRGGSNNQKVAINPELVNDVIVLGVHGAAKKHKITPQSLYQRLYYKHGVTVKELREKAKALTAQPAPSSTGDGNAHSASPPTLEEPCSSDLKPPEAGK